MNKQTENVTSSFQQRLKSYQSKSKINLKRSPCKNRSPLRDLTKSTSKLVNATTKQSENRKSNNGTTGEDHEWTKTSVSAALNPAPSSAFPPPPSVISPNKRRYPSPPSNNYYAQSFRETSGWDKAKPRAKSNDRGTSSSSGGTARLQGGIGSLRKSAIRDVMRKFKCEDNTRVTTAVLKANITCGERTDANLKTSSRPNKQRGCDGEKAASRSSYNQGCDDEEATQRSSYNRGGDVEDTTKRSSYNSSAVSLTLLRVEIVGLKSQVCDMEAQAAKGKSKLEKEEQRHKKVESHLQRDVEQVKIQLKRVKIHSREEKRYLQSQIQDMDDELKETKQVSKTEKLKRKEVESQLLDELETLQKNQYHTAKSEELQKKYQDLRQEMKIREERLKVTRRSQKESDTYVRTMETNMDQQLSIWQSEETSFQDEIKLIKEMLTTKNKEYSALCEDFKEKERTLVNKLQNYQSVHSITQNELNKFQSMTRELKEEKDKALQLQNASRTMKEQHTELVYSLRKRISKSEDDTKRYKEYIEKYRKKKKDLEHEKNKEIDKLKEELKHAQFRVHVLKTEVREASPKRNRVKNGSRNLMDELQEELNKSRQETEEVQTQLEECFSNIESDCDKTRREPDVDTSHRLESSSQEKNALQAEIEILTKQLNDDRSRSRRIAIKSETELAKVRDAEEALTECADKHEEEVKKWKAQSQQIERKYKEEVKLRKDIEAILQKKIKTLSQDLNTTSSTHNSIEEQTISLALVVTKLMACAREMKESLQQKCEIEQSSVDALINDFDKLKVITIKLEVKVKEDLEKQENALQMLQIAVDTYEDRIEKSSMKHEKIKSGLQQSILKQGQQVKQQQQVELDLLSKYTGLKGRYAQLQQDYEKCKAQAEEQEQKHFEVESWFLKEFSRMEAILPKEENSLVQQRFSKIIGTSPREGMIKKMRMKLQQGPSMEEVEVRLREDDELSHQCSVRMISQTSELKLSNLNNCSKNRRLKLKR